MPCIVDMVNAPFSLAIFSWRPLTDMRFWTVTMFDERPCQTSTQACRTMSVGHQGSLVASVSHQPRPAKYLWLSLAVLRLFLAAAVDHHPLAPQAHKTQVNFDQVSRQLQRLTSTLSISLLSIIYFSLLSLLYLL